MTPDERLALEEERDFLLRSIDDLEAERAAGDIDDSDYRRLSDEYTAKAARVIRALDGPATATATAGFGVNNERIPLGIDSKSRKRGARGALTAVAVLLVAVLAGIAVAQSAGRRDPGQAATGSIVQGSTDRITQAQVLVSEGKLLEAVKLYDAILRDDPENPVALAQRGWLVSRVDASLVDVGLANIEQAIAVDPGYAEAHFFRGMILWQAKNDPKGAADAFQKAIDAGPPPDLKTFLETERDRALAEAAAGG